jgi:hypothetical protein
MSTASQGKCCIRSLLLVDLQKPLQGEVGDHIAIVAEYSLVLVQKIFNVFKSPCCVQKDWLMAKKYGDTAPLLVRELFMVGFR